MYVQHLLSEQAECVGQLIDNNASIYVCGDGARMAADVKKCLLDIFQRRGSCRSPEDARLLLEDMTRRHRYQVPAHWPRRSFTIHGIRATANSMQEDVW